MSVSTLIRNVPELAIVVVFSRCRSGGVAPGATNCGSACTLFTSKPRACPCANVWFVPAKTCTQPGWLLQRQLKFICAGRSTPEHHIVNTVVDGVGKTSEKMLFLTSLVVEFVYQRSEQY